MLRFTSKLQVEKTFRQSKLKNNNLMIRFRKEAKCMKLKYYFNYMILKIGIFIVNITLMRVV